MEEERVDIRSHLDVILRRKWLVAGACLVSIVSALYYTHKSPPVYQARATIIVSQNPHPLLGVPLYSTSRTSLTNHCLVLKSDALTQRVANSISQERLRELGQRGINLFSLLRRNVSVSPIRDSNIIEVKAHAGDPSLAALMANKTVEAYIQYDLEDKRGEMNGVSEFVERQLKVVEHNLAKSEEELRNYKKTHQLIRIDEKAAQVVDRLAQFEAVHRTAEVELDVLERKLKLLQNRLGEEEKEALKWVANLSAPVVTGLKASLVELESERASLLIQAYSEDDPKLRELDDKIEKTQQSLRETLSTMLANRGQLDPMNQVEELMTASLSTQLELEIQKAREKALEDVIAAYEGELRGLPDKELTYARLSRAKAANEKIYMMLLERAEEARIAEAGEIGSIRMLDPAVKPSWPVKPSKKRNLAMGVLLGLFLGVGLSFVLEYTDVSVKNEHDVEKASELPVLATIPVLDNGNALALLRKRKEDTNPASSLIIHKSPKSAACEAYRTLRTGVLFSQADTPLKTVLITSPEPRAGKTTSTANLGITLANAGGSTLIVDSDLRRPMLSRMFGMREGVGLSNILVGRNTLEDAVRDTEVERLSIIPCGEVPPNPAELLGSNRMKELMGTLRSRYDWVLFDSPFIVGLTDGSLLGSMADGVLMVVDHGRTSKEVLSKAKRLLDEVGAKVLGVVLNKMDVARRGYGYYHYSRYYPYYYYYGEGEEKKGRRGHGRKSRKLAESQTVK